MPGRQHHRRMVPAVSRERSHLGPRSGRHVEVPEIRWKTDRVRTKANESVIALAHAIPVAASSSGKGAHGFPRIRDRVITVHVVQIERGEPGLTGEDITILIVGHRDGMMPSIARRTGHLGPANLCRKLGNQTKNGGEKKEVAHGVVNHKRNHGEALKLRLFEKSLPATINRGTDRLTPGRRCCLPIHLSHDPSPPLPPLPRRRPLHQHPLHGLPRRPQQPPHLQQCGQRHRGDGLDFAGL